MVLFFPSDLPACLLFVLQLWALNWWLTCWYETSWGRSRTPCCWMFRTWPNTRTWSEQSEPIVWECLLWDQDGPSRWIFQVYRKDKTPQLSRMTLILRPNTSWCPVISLVQFRRTNNRACESSDKSLLKFVLLTFESAHYPVWNPEWETRFVLLLTSTELEACSQTQPDRRCSGTSCVSFPQVWRKVLDLWRYFQTFRFDCKNISYVVIYCFLTLITHPCWRELKEVKEAAECWRKCINLYANKGF